MIVAPPTFTPEPTPTKTPSPVATPELVVPPEPTETTDVYCGQGDKGLCDTYWRDNFLFYWGKGLHSDNALDPQCPNKGTRIFK